MTSFKLWQNCPVQCECELSEHTVQCHLLKFSNHVFPAGKWRLTLLACRINSSNSILVSVSGGYLTVARSHGFVFRHKSILLRTTCFRGKNHSRFLTFSFWGPQTYQQNIHAKKIQMQMNINSSSTKGTALHFSLHSLLCEFTPQSYYHPSFTSCLFHYHSRLTNMAHFMRTVGRGRQAV